MRSRWRRFWSRSGTTLACPLCIRVCSMYLHCMASSSIRKHIVPVRFSDSGLGWIDEKRKKFYVTKADVIREALALAAKYETEFDRRLSDKGEF